jgi:hypothetical protein
MWALARFVYAVAALAFSAQGAAAQLAEKKVLTLAAAQKMVAAARVRHCSHCRVDFGPTDMWRGWET